MKRSLRMLVGLAAAVWATVALAQQEAAYTIPHFRFENGADFEGLKIGYATYGQLNADKSNAVLLVPGTSSLRNWADAYIGPGKMYDTNKYFFIAVDAIGGGTSSQPKDNPATSFPSYTIRDIVRAEHEGFRAA